MFMMILDSLLKQALALVFAGLCVGQLWAQADDWRTRFELSDSTETVTYHEGIAYLERLAAASERIQLQTYGNTDAGFPLHLAVVSTSGVFDSQALRAQGKAVFLVNNAIHPGEPDGVDASLLLLREIAFSDRLDKVLHNTVLIIIPFYNIGGALNRNSTTRVNQDGPLAYGFRGNANNLDLNRDFIKMDSENAFAFVKIFQTWQPDLYLENHVTNGADYQHIMTLLATQEDKLGAPLGAYMRQKFSPTLDDAMRQAGFPAVPYVNVYNRPPDDGYNQFFDSPRYSSGYAALFHTPGYVAETHMLKPYRQRVIATLALMKTLLQILQTEGAALQQQRKAQAIAYRQASQAALRWQHDPNQYRLIPFDGYEATRIPSKVTTGDRLFYDRSKPYSREVKFFDHYQTAVQTDKPWAYVIPASRRKVWKRLQANGVQLQQLTEAVMLEAEVSYIESFETLKSPFEGHYLHYNTSIRRQTESLTIPAGDYVALVDQASQRFLLEVLEPEAHDSYFNWNFFDEILQQKEGYSAYVFEDIAANLLAEDQALKQAFEAQKAQDADFAQNPAAQLDFIYKRSPYYEKAHLRYPVLRLPKQVLLPFQP